MRVLVCDDERVFRDSLAKMLRRIGHQVETVSTGEEALSRLREEEVDVILCDLRLPNIDGIEVLRQALLLSPQTGVLIMTAYSSVETAIQALREGAFDYMVKPVLHEDLRARLARFEEILSLRQRNELFRRQLARQWDKGPLIGESPAFKAIIEQVDRVARTDSTVLLTGESGTGKELLARTMHRESRRSGGPFAPINLAAIPDSLIDSQLFGHTRGAFTGAVNASPGLFISAKEGTLFLDEIGELPPPLQAKLLRVVENREVLPLGSTKTRKTDVRLIASTNRDLTEAIADGSFRADLYYRLAVVAIHMPPLRNRTEDIPALVDHFLERYRKEAQTGPQTVDGAAMRLLLAYRWPGNVRELKNVIERGCVFCNKDVVTVEDLPTTISGQTRPAARVSNLKHATRAFERVHIESVLHHVNGDKKAAAESLGIGLSSLYRKLESTAPKTRDGQNHSG